MSKITFSFGVVLALLATVFPSAICAQTSTAKTPRNVTDFFLLLPNKYVNNYSIQKRQAALKKSGTVDAANGYLEVLAADENTPSIYIGIFKKDTGKYTVSVMKNRYDSKLEKQVTSYDFLDYDGKKFYDVSKSVLPADFKFKDFSSCEMPRYNRTFTCRKDDGKLTYLGWTGNAFVVE